MFEIGRNSWSDSDDFEFDAWENYMDWLDVKNAVHNAGLDGRAEDLERASKALARNSKLFKEKKRGS